MEEPAVGENKADSRRMFGVRQFCKKEGAGGVRRFTALYGNVVVCGRGGVKIVTLFCLEQ